MTTLNKAFVLNITFAQHQNNSNPKKASPNFPEKLRFAIRESFLIPNNKCDDS